jgi:hypothetical protein
MKNQVLSIEQMRKLKELGVDTSKASMHFLYMPTAKSIMSGVYEVDDEPEVFVSQNGMNHEHPTFTLQDIIELLPKSIIINSVKHWFCVCQNYLLTEFQVMYFDGYDPYGVMKQDKSLLQAAYEMLIWVAENGYLTAK